MTGFGGAPGSRGHSGSGGVGAKLARVKAERGWKESERRRQAKSCCSRWAETSESSVRSVMSIVQTVLHRHKLRQEQHGLEHRNYRTRGSLPAKHAAPDGAWMASGGLGCYKHATPTELLCPGPLPPEPAMNLFFACRRDG